MDGGISNMISSVLSNPDALNKLMTAMPAVAQMMNGGGLNDSAGSQNYANKAKTVETTAANAHIPAEDLMADSEVAAALKNLITALNRASAAAKPAETIAAIPAMAAGSPDDKDEKIEKTLDTLKNFSSATNPESDNRSKLLLALKPFLKDTRKTKIDTAIKYMNAAKIISLFGKNGFV